MSTVYLEQIMALCISCEKPAQYFPKNYITGNFNPLCLSDFRKYYETGFFRLPGSSETVVKKMSSALRNEELITNYMIANFAWKNKFFVHRIRLVAHLQIKRTTVYDALVRLELKGIIKRFSKNTGKPGRPLVFWQLTGPEF